MCGKLTFKTVFMILRNLWQVIYLDKIAFSHRLNENVHSFVQGGNDLDVCVLAIKF